jgi:DNA-directed RNA polymerase sigma subunit (sigma70/sigma32)
MSKERMSLEEILGRQNNMTQHEVAEALGISRSQVDTLEKLALRKLRYYLKQKNYTKEDFLV